MAKSGLEKIILKLHDGPQSCCCPVQKKIAQKGCIEGCFTAAQCVKGAFTNYFCIFWHFLTTYVPSLHFLCSKLHVYLTTYPTLSANVIYEGSLRKKGCYIVNPPDKKLKKPTSLHQNYFSEPLELQTMNCSQKTEYRAQPMHLCPLSN